MKKLILYGVSSYTKSVCSILSQKKDYDVVYICVDDKYITKDLKTFYNIPVIPASEAITNYPHYEFFICIGYSKMRNRENCYKKLKAHNISLATIVSSNAAISNIKLEEGVIIFDGVVIEHGCEIGSNVTIWSNNTICHDTKIAPHCFIAANSTIGGFCDIGELSFLGFNTTIADHVSIGSECLIGAGSLILKDVPGLSQYIGSPAKKVKSIDRSLGVRL